MPLAKVSQNKSRQGLAIRRGLAGQGDSQMDDFTKRTAQPDGTRGEVDRISWICNVGGSTARLSIQVLAGGDHRLSLMIDAGIIGTWGAAPAILYPVTVFGYEIVRFCQGLSAITARGAAATLSDVDGVEVLKIQLTSEARGLFTVSGRIPLNVITDEFPNGFGVLSAQFNGFEIDQSYLPSLSLLMLDALSAYDVDRRNPYPPEIFLE